MRAVLRTWPAVIVVSLLLLPLVAAWAPTSADLSDESQLGPPFSGIALATSVLVAFAVAALSVLIGFGFSLLLTFTDARGAALIGTLVLIPFVCPHAVWALAQIYCYGAGGLVDRCLGDGIQPLLTWLNRGHYLSSVIVMAQIYAPLALLLILRGTYRVRLAGWEAALLFLAPRQRVAWLLRSLRGEVAGACLLVFSLALGNFAVPHVLQCRLYVNDIYMRAANYFDHLGALLLALPLLSICVTATATVVLIDMRSGSATGTTPQRSPPALLTARRLFYIVAGTYLFFTVCLPVIALMIECQSVTYFMAAVRDAAEETGNTLGLAASVTLLVVVAAVLLRTMPSSIAQRLSSGVSFAMLGIPSLIIAISYARSFVRVDALGWDIHRTFGAAVVLALVCRVWPYAARAMTDARRRHSSAWGEASKLSQLTTTTHWRWISWPMSFDYLLSAAIVAFVVSASDLEICQMLCEPGQGPLTLRLFTSLHFGPTHVAASLALVQLALTSIPVLIYFLVCDRFLRVV